MPKPLLFRPAALRSYIFRYQTLNPKEYNCDVLHCSQCFSDLILFNLFLYLVQKDDCLLNILVFSMKEGLLFEWFGVAVCNVAFEHCRFERQPSARTPAKISQNWINHNWELTTLFRLCCRHFSKEWMLKTCILAFFDSFPFISFIERFLAWKSRGKFSKGENIVNIAGKTTP